MRKGQLARWLPFILIGAVLLLGLGVNNYQRAILTVVAIYTTVALGLDILFGMAGQLSLGQGVFLGIGAYGTAILSGRFHVPIPLAVLAAILVTMALAWTIGRPLLRMRGSTFALATLALPIIVENLARGFVDFTGGPAGFDDVPALQIGPFVIDRPLELFFLAWGMVLIAYLIVVNLKNSRFGRAWLAIKSDETAGMSLGIDVGHLKLVAFMLSAAFAATGGAVYAFYIRFLSPDLFSLKSSIEFLVMVVLGGAGSIWGTFAGAAIVRGAPEFIQALRDYQILAYGLVLTFVLLRFPDGIAGGVVRLTQRWPWLSRLTQSPEPDTAADMIEYHPPRFAGGQSVLKVEGLTKRFGGLTVMEGISFTVRSGTIKAIIGPNGAGKTTLINLVTGHLRPDAGRIQIQGVDVTGWSPHRIALAGVARTFQLVRLMRATVTENVAVGFHRTLRSTLWQSMLGWPIRKEEDQVRREVAGLLSFVGLKDHGNTVAFNLPSGYQRLAEIARALAVKAELLVLDEPAAGLSEVEVQALMRLLNTLRAAGTTIILIEHNMKLVMDVSDEVLVLANGQLVAEGPPAVIQRNPEVLRVYLGDGSEAV